MCACVCALLCMFVLKYVYFPHVLLADEFIMLAYSIYSYIEYSCILHIYPILQAVIGCSFKII